jgi:hypothetical protein
MNWKKLSRWTLPILIVLVLLAMQAAMLAAAKPAAAPLAVTDTPTQEYQITNTPADATPHPHPTNTPVGYYYRPVPGGPGNLDNVLLTSLLVVGGLALLIFGLWYIPRLNRRKG